MTEQTKIKKWRTFIFFGLIVSLFAYFIFFLITDRIDPIYERMSLSQAQKSSILEDNRLYSLFIEKPITIGKLKLTYRGIRSQTVLIDLVVVELDPDYAYQHRIGLSDARRGFELFDQMFVLKAAGPRKIKLAPHPEPSTR